LIIIKLCLPKEEITEETSLTEATQMSFAALTALKCALKIRPSRDSRCVTWLTDQAREISKTTLLLIQSTSTCPKSTSNSNIASLVVFTLVLFVFVPQRSAVAKRVKDSSVTLPNSDITSVLKQLLDQQLSHLFNLTNSNSLARKTPRRNDLV
jgi:hypothetical protein